MKTLSAIFRIFIFALVAAISTDAAAQKKKAETVTTLPDIHAATKAENIAFPVVGEKLHKPLADYMLREAQAILKQGYQVETERQGEVIVVTIPASSLFMPNATTLEVEGRKLLDPFTAYLHTPGRFKILLAMHSDDTGSESYLTQLTTDRLKAVTDYIAAKTSDTSGLVGYAIGAKEPVRPNSNIANRACNRRLEIYIVPDEELLHQLAKR